MKEIKFPQTRDSIVLMHIIYRAWYSCWCCAFFARRYAVQLALVVDALGACIKVVLLMLKWLPHRHPLHMNLYPALHHRKILTWERHRTVFLTLRFIIARNISFEWTESIPKWSRPSGYTSLTKFKPQAHKPKFVRHLNVIVDFSLERLSALIWAICKHRHGIPGGVVFDGFFSQRINQGNLKISMLFG